MVNIDSDIDNSNKYDMNSANQYCGNENNYNGYVNNNNNNNIYFQSLNIRFNIYK